MLTLAKTRRAFTVTAAALAIAGGTAIGVGGTANAATSSCGIINIGNPGNVTEHGVYAGAGRAGVQHL